MKRLIAVTCLFLASIPVCSAQEKLRIVTTTSDLRSLAKAVGAEQVIVSSIIPQGESPEEYQPKLQDLDFLKGAKIVIRAGTGRRSLVRQTARARRCKHDASPGFHAANPAISTHRPRSPTTRSPSAPPSRRSRRASRGGPNPHYWLDPKSADAITEKMVETFSKLDPKNAKYYADNRKTFLARLDGKITEWQARLAPFRKEPMIAFPRRLELFREPLPSQHRGLHGRARSRAAQARQDRGAGQADEGQGIKLILAEVNQPERHANKLAQQPAPRSGRSRVRSANCRRPTITFRCSRPM
jgi:ABC-type Zn uptake system ZnuABC Zn-binding protein ZnuA